MPEPRQPNILVISLDALRRDFISLYNSDGVDDPVFRRAADEGIVFTSAVTSGNWTIPSHASLFSGLEPQEHRIGNWFEALPPSTPTLFSRARSAGYKVGFLATDGIQPIVSERPEDFDVIGPAWNKGARAQVAEKADEPWCVFWHFLHTHAPYGFGADEPVDMAYVDMDLQSHAMNYVRMLVCQNRVDEIHAAIRENLARATRAVAEMWDVLGKNTIVVLLSDHGEDWRPYFPFHCSFEEPVLPVPLVISAPGLTARRNDLLVAHADLSDLILRLADTDSAFRDTIIENWKPKSNEFGRVVISGPDAFDNDVCYLAVRDRERMIVVRPRIDKRRRYELLEGGTRRQVDRWSDARDDHLDRVLDKVVAQYWGHVDEPVKLEDDEVVLERLRALGYL